MVDRYFIIFESCHISCVMIEFGVVVFLHSCVVEMLFVVSSICNQSVTDNIYVNIFF